MPNEVKKPNGEKKEDGAKKTAVTEKPANCMKCNKRLKRKSWYYRNGNYYCSKGCWKQAVSKKKENKP